MPPLWMVLRPFTSSRVVPHPALTVSVPPSGAAGSSAVLSLVPGVGLPAPAPGPSVPTSSVPNPAGAASPIPGVTASSIPGVALLAPLLDGAFDAMVLLGGALVGSPLSVPHAKRSVPRPSKARARMPMPRYGSEFRGSLSSDEKRPLSRRQPAAGQRKNLIRTGVEGRGGCRASIHLAGGCREILPARRTSTAWRARQVEGCRVMSPYRELDCVIVRTLRTPTREVSGTDQVVRQPRVGDQGSIVHVLDSTHVVVECVDSSGYTPWVADFHVEELARLPKGWTFEVAEVSPGAYCAVARGPRNMRAESTDTDPDKALADCRAFALRYPE